MIKLIAIVFCAWIAFMVLPGALAVAAGFVLVGALLSLIFSGIGSLMSVIGSTMASILGGIFSVLLALAVAAAFVIGLPAVLLIAIPAGLLLLFGGIFCSFVCCVA